MSKTSTNNDTNFTAHHIIEIHYDYIIWCSRKFFQSGNDLYNDLAHECCLIILGLSQEKIKQLFEDDRIKSYIWRIVFTQATNKKNPFWKKYREFGDLKDVSGGIDTPTGDVSRMLNELTEIEEKVLAIYMEEQSINSMNKKTNIHRKILTRYVNQIKTKLSKHL